MPYYIRVLTPSAEPVRPSVLRDAAEQCGARLREDTLGAAWSTVEILNANGEPVCVIERNSVEEGSLASEEISEFREEIPHCLPKSAADWLDAYLDTVKTMYAIQILDAVYDGDGWELVGSINSAIWNAGGGIFQSDGEGFSNEEGYHILWQFSDSVTGDWWMAVLKDGAWQNFKMDVGNPAHRLAFQRGEVPHGAERAN